MIPSSPKTIRTHKLRPEPVGSSRRFSVVDSFRPVLAGQYLRSEQDIGQTEFTFLVPPGFRTAMHHYSLNVSPRLIWRTMNFTTVSNSSAIDRSIISADSANPKAPFQSSMRPVDNHPDQSFSATAVPDRPTGTSVIDRFISLTDLANWVVSTVRTSTSDSASVRSTHDFAPLFLHYDNGRSVVPGFFPSGKPSSLESHSRPRHGECGMQTGGEVYHSSFPLDQDRTHNNASWYVTGTAPYRASTMTLISSAARLAAAERHSPLGFSGRHQVQRSPDVKTGVTKRTGFGGIASVGVHRSANLIPVIFRAHQDNNSEHEADGANPACLPGGKSAAQLFASNVSMRHVRSESSPASPSFAMAVALVVRETPQASVFAERSKSMDFSIPSASERSNVAPLPQGLPPGLMQQLTEQVVRALDSRTLAASERAGRF